MDNILSDIELRRYSQQMLLDEIGIYGQEKLKKTRVLVVGAGSLGTPVMQYLAAAGIGTIGICDNDHVDETNFHRQIMYGASDLGKLKTIVAKEKLKLLNPMVEFNIHNIFLKEENAAIIVNGYDLVLDCTGDTKTTQILTKTCKEFNIQIVAGNFYQFIGKVTVIDPKSDNFTPLFPDLKDNVRKESGKLGMIPGIIGCIQASESLKLLLDYGTPLKGKILTFDTLKMEISIV